MFAISDLGSFFVAERLPAVLEYEQSVPKKMDFALRAVCSYHKDDFATLSRQQQARILAAHNHATVYPAESQLSA